MKISINLKQLLEEKNITIYKISKDMNIDSSLLYQILRGDVENPRVLTLKKITDYLGVTVDELIKEVDKHE